MASVRELPEPLINKYRSVQLERLDRLESCWMALRESGSDLKREQDLHRGLEALKGDSRALGFSDVSFLCQKLEDLLFFSRQRRYVVPDELDMLVTMALQFMALLIRRKTDSKPAGVDLKGFVRQLEEVLRSAQAEAPVDSGPGGSELDEGERISAATRQRLARAATSVYLEALNAWGPSVVRLRQAWESLVKETFALEAVPLLSVLVPLRDAALARAKELGTPLDIFLDVGGHRATSDVAQALEVVVRVALVLAVESSIEPREERARAGKRDVGTVRVRAREEGDRLEVVVEDDGRGMNLDDIRRRAVESGMLSSPAAETASEEELVELLFHPFFFSDARRGLHLVRAAVTRVGGTTELWSRAGVGASMVLRAPKVSRVMEVLRLTLPGSPLAFAVPSAWSVLSGTPTGAVPRLDPLALLGLPRGEEPGRREVVRLRRQGMELELICRGRPMLGKADRFCATDDDSTVEVVRIAGDEALLIRPERLLAAAPPTKP